MLNLSLREVAGGEVRIRGDVPPDDPLWEGTELVVRDPLQVDLTARPVGDDGVLVRGQLRTTLELECRRCLQPVEREIDETVDFLFDEIGEGEDLEGEVYPLPESGDTVDLTEPLREELLLRVPRLVTCREECKGLCPQCGANRNATACDCVPEASPSPWDALKKIDFD